MLDEANDSKVREEIRSVAKYVFFMFYQYETVSFCNNFHNIRICLNEPHYMYLIFTLLCCLSFLFLPLLFSELETERRALEESERERRLLASRVEDLSGRLELSERERREVMAELDAATKRLDQSEGGKNALVDQVIKPTSFQGGKIPEPICIVVRGYLRVSVY